MSTSQKSSPAESSGVEKGPETLKSEVRWRRDGLFDKYMKGNGLDIGFRGSVANASPVLPSAIGIEMDYPGYDGKTLPFPDRSQDYVYASHCLEHIEDSVSAIREWFRVLKMGGHLIIMVPHQFLYEKSNSLPSRWNEDHKRFYTPRVLLSEVERALVPNTYRLRYCCDNDEGFDYSIPDSVHSHGEYQMEIVLQKIQTENEALKVGWIKDFVESRLKMENFLNEIRLMYGNYRLEILLQKIQIDSKLKTENLLSDSKLKIEKITNELESMKRGPSWKIGRAITWPFRMAKRWLVP